MFLIDKVPYPAVDEFSIKGFFKEYRFLSNYHLCNVLYNGYNYPSSEHAYMAAKTDDPFHKSVLANGISTPKLAKAYGQTIPLVDNWDKIKIMVMIDVIYCKFSQNSGILKLLLETGNRELEETNYWNDTYWGVCNSIGHNNLGKSLMAVRRRILDAQ